MSRQNIMDQINELCTAIDGVANAEKVSDRKAHEAAHQRVVGAGLDLLQTFLINQDRIATALEAAVVGKGKGK